MELYGPATQLDSNEIAGARALLSEFIGKAERDCKFLHREASTYWFRLDRRLLGVSLQWGFKDRGEVFGV